ncbi:MAG TPA: hypothetical protein VF331_27885 [Polyangiales bacterium]
MLATLALLAVLAADHATLAPTPLFPLDDAYITLHNAGVLLAGHDRSFPGVPALVGATSAIHLALVAVLGTVMPLAWAGWSAAWLAIGLLAAGVCRLVTLARMPLSLGAAALAVALLGADAPYHLLNGIETGLAMAAVIWACALHLQPQPARSWPLPVLCGALPLVRPELGLLSALILVDRALAAQPGARLRSLIGDGLLAVGVALPAVLAYWLTTGAAVPQTMSAKQHFFAESCRSLPHKLAWFLAGLGGFASRLQLTAVGFALLLLAGWRRVTLGFSVGLLAVYVVAFPEAAHHNDHRYLYPLMPLSVVGFVLAFMRAQGRWRIAVGWLLACAGLASVLGLPRVTYMYLRDLTFTERELAGVASFVQRTIPETQPLLVHDIGFISDHVPNRLVDVVGLKDRGAAELHRKLTWASCGHGRAQVLEQLALQRHARYFVVFSRWDSMFSFTAGLQARGWGLRPLRALDVAYQVYALTPPAEVVR